MNVNTYIDIELTEEDVKKIIAESINKNTAARLMWINTILRYMSGCKKKKKLYRRTMF